MPTTIAVRDANQVTQTVATLDAIAALIGEVQVSPTDNTLLDRLKDLLTGIVLAAGTNEIGKLAAGTASIGATKDDLANFTTVWGVSNAPVSSADMSGGDADLTAAPTAGQKWVITDVFVSADTAMRVDIKEETSGTVFFSGYVTAGGIYQLCPRGKRKLATADKKVVGRTSAAGNVRILIGAHSEA